jgi:hypothetical protein
MTPCRAVGRAPTRARRRRRAAVCPQLSSLRLFPCLLEFFLLAFVRLRTDRARHHSIARAQEAHAPSTRARAPALAPFAPPPPKKKSRSFPDPPRSARPLSERPGWRSRRLARGPCCGDSRRPRRPRSSRRRRCVFVDAALVQSKGQGRGADVRETETSLPRRQQQTGPRRARPGHVPRARPRRRDDRAATPQAAPRGASK